MIILESEKQLLSLVDEDTQDKVRTSRDYVIRSASGSILMAFQWIDKTPVKLYMEPEHTSIWAMSPVVRSYAEKISGTGKEELFEFFTVLAANDLRNLEELEDRIVELEDRLFDETESNKENFHEIHLLRKETWRKKRYCEKMELLTDELMQNDEYFVFIDKKFDKLFNYILRTQEYLEQVRQAYESQIDIQQNSLMKFFTVVTSIFLPLTLIAGWYGMNLQMPEFQWAHGYPVVIALSVGIVLLMIWLFRKNKWL